MPVSKASLHDVPELTNLVNSAYRGESSARGWTTEAYLLEGIRIDEATFSEYFTNPDITILKYTNSEDQIIACVYLQQQSNKLYLGMLTVKPELQTQGIGRALLQIVEEYARQLKCIVITMTVITKRDELIAYYQRRGYRITGETEPFPVEHHKFGIPKEKLELMIMEKSLTD